MTALPTFEVDKAGLAKLLERRGKHWVLAELFQNAVDENVTRVEMTITAPEGGLCEVSVTDDNPEGFRDIAHAYTLFADSAKKDDPTKRGRFNLGEKLVIALCREARIVTTKGTVVFNDDGRFMETGKRKKGSKFEGMVPMNEQEYDAAVAFVHTLIVPEGVTFVFNGTPLPGRVPLRTFEASLRTERADAEGVLRPTTRKATVRVFDTRDGEGAHLYEMGIPVVETGDRYHVDVGQKVPLNTDRDNVPPAFLKDVRAHVLNQTYDILSDGDAAETWVNRALEDELVEPAAIQAVVTARFGEKVVLADPTDREAEQIAVAEGYRVVTGGALPKAAFGAIKANSIILPAGQVTPSPKGDPGAKRVPREHTTLAVRRYCEFVEALAPRLHDVAPALVGPSVTVSVINEPQSSFRATYCRMGLAGEMQFNLGRLGHKAFEDLLGPVFKTVIHEFAHHTAPDHLTAEFYDACCKVGAAVAVVLATDREFVAEWGLAPDGATA